jgi:hypothetical protein
MVRVDEALLAHGGIMRVGMFGRDAVPRRGQGGTLMVCVHVRSGVPSQGEGTLTMTGALRPGAVGDHGLGWVHPTRCHVGLQRAHGPQVAARYLAHLGQCRRGSS